VATGFETDDLPGMKPMGGGRLQRAAEAPVRAQAPVAAPALEPVKPAAPQRAPQRPAEQVVLGAKSTRYSNIDALLSKPAYQSRNSKFVERVSGGRKEVLRDKTAENQAPKEEPDSGSLFD